MDAHFTETLEDFMESALVMWVCSGNYRKSISVHRPCRIFYLSYNQDGLIYVC